jgi:hypothetical protein
MMMTITKAEKSFQLIHRTRRKDIFEKAVKKEFLRSETT